MQHGSLPTASIYGTWLENVEIWDVDTDTRLDLSSLVDAQVILRDLVSKNSELVLMLSNGDVEIVAPGVLQWRAEVGAMGTLVPKLYEVLLILEDDTDTVPLILGSISIVE